MTDFERFVEFIRREAATYNEPPETPTAEMWEGLAAALDIEDMAPGKPSPILMAEDSLLDAETLYNEPPQTPREPMWERIEAAWLLRRSAPPAAREAGLSDLREDEPLFDFDAEEKPDRRSVALWVTGVAVAASILFGFVVGRGMPSLDPSVPQVATELGETGAATELAIDAPPVESADAAAGEPELTDPSLEPLETGPAFVAAGTTSAPRDRPIQTELAAPERTETRPDRRQRIARYATSAHLGRTETLLAAFGAGDSEPGQMSDLAQAARNLLGETRLLLDMSVTRSRRERALLEEIELFLAQIARLGPDAPAFERDIITEGLERLGTVASLRDVAPQFGT